MSTELVTNSGIVIENAMVNFDGTQSSDGNGIVKYEWDFDDTDGIGIDA